MLRQPVDATIGNSDMVPLWNLKAPRGHAYHWDGLNTDLREVVLSSAIGDGATPKWVDRDMREVGQHRPAHDVEPAARAELHQHRAGAGLSVSRSTRAGRRGRGHLHGAVRVVPRSRAAARTGTVIPLAEVGTDRHRLDMWTKPSAAAYNAYGDGHAWKFSHFRTTDGYVSVPLDGLWLRAPYLHNGSVPTLADLLEPVEQRPTQFWRGYDVYDPVRVGFVTERRRSRTRRHAVRHVAAGQQQRRAYLRHATAGRRQARAARVPEDAVKRTPVFASHPVFGLSGSRFWVAGSSLRSACKAHQSHSFSRRRIRGNRLR